jgi:hypothetical protein
VKVLLIEFNELSPVLLDRFMAAGLLPNFRRIYESSHVFTTDAHAQPPALEPWVQWPTVHLGVSHLDHGLRHLGTTRSDDDAAQGRPARKAIAQLVSDAGLRAGICGSMNVPYGEFDGFFIPDAWNSGTSAVRPDYLKPYLRTIGAMVRESSRTEGFAPGAGLLPFGYFLLRHGLTPRTVALLVKQLASERRDPGVRWRRASALDWIQYDVFRNVVARENVDFATFFSNSTAHYQHYFWRHMNPEAFDTPPEPGDHPSFEGAVLFGYQSMDRILGRMLADFPETTLVLCTALSQQPWTDATKQTYRPKNWEAVLRLAGYSTTDVDVQSIMAEQFVARFKTKEEAQRAQEAFARLTVDGEALTKFTLDGDALIGGCSINRAGVLSSHISGTADGSTSTFGEVFRPIHTVRSGRHSSEGALWFRTGNHVKHEQPVPLEDVAPTLLALMGVSVPTEMTGSVLPLAMLAPQR